ncbi:hypothetical protein J6590_065648 [Homalodisca vitripennis]|nr:hypothetical protein J6590_065648 [Homalodisca vitripennis]
MSADLETEQRVGDSLSLQLGESFMCTGAVHRRLEIHLCPHHSVARVLEFKVEPTMIGDAHRLAAIPGRSGPRSLIVKFCRRFDMKQLRRLAIRYKGFSASNLGFLSD